MWFKKEKEEDVLLFTAEKAKLVTTKVKGTISDESHRRILRSIKYKAQSGEFGLICEGPKYFEHYNLGSLYTILLNEDDVKWLKSMGYKVTEKIRDVQYRTGLTNGDVEFSVKQYTYYMVSWK